MMKPYKKIKLKQEIPLNTAMIMVMVPEKIYPSQDNFITGTVLLCPQCHNGFCFEPAQGGRQDNA
jgi:hypothetical protein